MVRVVTRRDLNDCHIQKGGSVTAFGNRGHRPARTDRSKLNESLQPPPEPQNHRFHISIHFYYTDVYGFLLHPMREAP